MERNYILFDLDGTLSDTGEGIKKAIQYALSKRGIIENNQSILGSFVGPPLREAFLDYGIEEEDVEEVLADYREYYQDTGIFESELYPNVAQMLENLYIKGKKLYLATCKPTIFSEQILRHFRIRQYFTGITGSTMDKSLIEKLDIMQRLIEVYQIPREEAIMVGDRRFDIDGAKKCSIPCIAVAYGYGTKEEIASHKPEYVVRTVRELQELLLT